MEQINGIRNIIFDLGGVLLDLDFNAPVKAFQKSGTNSEHFDYRQAITDPVFIQFETGSISPSEFRGRIRQLLGNNHLKDAEIDEAWCSMMGSVPSEKIDLLKRLAIRYRLFLFSNTNVIHTGYFKRRFEAEHHIPIESLFEKAFYSQEIHDRKPQISAFEKVTRLAGILPCETLFVDDFEQNIANAEKFGFQVLHYVAGTDLAKALTKKGITD